MCSDATRLQLRKPVPIEDIADTLEKIRASTEIPDADKLNPMKKLSFYFPQDLAEEKVHLVVQVPPSGEY